MPLLLSCNTLNRRRNTVPKYLCGEMWTGGRNPSETKELQKRAGGNTEKREGSHRLRLCNGRTLDRPGVSGPVPRVRFLNLASALPAVLTPPKNLRDPERSERSLFARVPSFPWQTTVAPVAVVYNHPHMTTQSLDRTLNLSAPCCVLPLNQNSWSFRATRGICFSPHRHPSEVTHHQGECAEKC
jgi:hypothetical protein